MPDLPCTTCLKSGQQLAIHGWIYDVGNGILKDLNTCIASNEEFQQTFGG